MISRSRLIRQMSRDHTTHGSYPDTS
ncbi:hypothetical protein RSAG8_01081, partial [Rhizoctonia solani AG-8 WAC10335]